MLNEAPLCFFVFPDRRKEKGHWFLILSPLVTLSFEADSVNLFFLTLTVQEGHFSCNL